MLKKSTLLCSCGGLQSLTPLPSIQPHSPPRSTARHSATTVRQCKRFAHVHESRFIEDDYTWPSGASFSPYDVVKQDRGAPYSKRRFYQLVKIYHPDRPCNEHPLCKDLSHSVRTQRYRLLVAAHELLSDPVKRDAFDKFGQGWYHRAELFGAVSKDALNMNYAERREVDPEIFRNATWQDWERYRQKKEGRQQQQSSPVSHGTFASLFLLLSLFGGAAQMVGAEKYSGYVDRRVAEVDKECGRILEGRRQETKSQLNSKDTRVQSFLKKRDPSCSGLNQAEQETYRENLGAHHESG